MSAIKLVVFDMAGTTIQDKKEVETCFAQACKKTNLEVTDERILALQGYSKIHVFKLLWGERLGDSHPELKEKANFSYDVFTEILENHYHQSPILPTDGCLETLSFLRENNIKIALTTGFYRKVTNIILGKLGWLDGLDKNHFNTSGTSIIDLSITSDEVEKGRPEPLMIQKAMKIFNITDPKEVINIGDTPSDLQSGVRAGCRLSLGLTNGTHTQEQLKIYRNDGLLSSLNELKAVIQPLI
ncbi:HAD hydrolase-like protein [Emticicia aquatica]|nr:HAD hydrolase-like protein [Emticicia aquatica]